MCNSFAVIIWKIFVRTVLVIKSIIFTLTLLIRILFLPFYSFLSNKIAKLLSSFHFTAAFKPANKVSFTFPKNRISLFDRSGVHCNRCEFGFPYIGQTQWGFDFRVKEHMNTSVRERFLNPRLLTIPRILIFSTIFFRSRFFVSLVYFKTF